MVRSDCGIFYRAAQRRPIVVDGIGKLVSLVSPQTILSFTSSIYSLHFTIFTETFLPGKILYFLFQNISSLDKVTKKPRKGGEALRLKVIQISRVINRK